MIKLFMIMYFFYGIGASVGGLEWDGTYTITAYTNGYESTGKTPEHPLYGITASGEKTKKQHTLACPPRFDFGTKIIIEGVGTRVCEDRGSAIQGNKLDLFIPNLERANNWGKQERRIYVIDGK